MKRAWNLFKVTFSTWFEIDPFQHSAALTFYALLSMAPILLVLVSVAGFMVEKEAVQALLFTQMSQFLEPKGIELMQQALENISVNSSSTWALIIGLGAILLGATAVVSQLKSSLNRIWSVSSDPHLNQIWSFTLTRLWALLVVGVMGISLVALLLASSLIGGFRDWLSIYIQISPGAISLLNLILFMGLYSLLWTLILKLLVDVKIPWSCALWGGVVTATLLQLSKSGISLYLKNNQIATVYGAAGSLALLLLWIYYSSLVLLFGASFTYALMKDGPQPFVLKRYAVNRKWEILQKK